MSLKYNVGSVARLSHCYLWNGWELAPRQSITPCIILTVIFQSDTTIFVMLHSLTNQCSYAMNQNYRHSRLLMVGSSTLYPRYQLSCPWTLVTFFRMSWLFSMSCYCLNRKIVSHQKGRCAKDKPIDVGPSLSNKLHITWRQAVALCISFYCHTLHDVGIGSPASYFSLTKAFSASYTLGIVLGGFSRQLSDNWNPTMASLDELQRKWDMIVSLGWPSHDQIITTVENSILSCI